MRIVDRDTFLGLPSGTIFMKFPAQPAEGKSRDYGYDEVIAIKGDTIGGDFVIQSLFPWFDGTTDSASFFDEIETMLLGKESPPLDYDCAGRDGLFDKDQLFAVWNEQDAKRLIDRLQQAYLSAYQASSST